MWQDTLIAVCQLAFLPAMWPTFRGKDKPAVSTSIMNVVIVSIIAFSLATLRLWLTFITTVLIALMWAVLAAQKIRLDSMQPVPTKEEVEESNQLANPN